MNTWTWIPLCPLCPASSLTFQFLVHIIFYCYIHLINIVLLLYPDNYFILNYQLVQFTGTLHIMYLTFFFFLCRSHISHKIWQLINIFCEILFWNIHEHCIDCPLWLNCSYEYTIYVDQFINILSCICRCCSYRRWRLIIGTSCLVVP